MDWSDTGPVFTAHFWGQVRYMLGDAGRSFVVGYGKDPPERAHHRGASCRPGDCSGAQLATPEPNPNIIRGALVGGAHNQGHFLCSLFFAGAWPRRAARHTQVQP